MLNKFNWFDFEKGIMNCESNCASYNLTFLQKKFFYKMPGILLNNWQSDMLKQAKSCDGFLKSLTPLQL